MVSSSRQEMLQAATRCVHQLLFYQVEAKPLAHQATTGFWISSLNKLIVAG